jgi:hypothetical protein
MYRRMWQTSHFIAEIKKKVLSQSNPYVQFTTKAIRCGSSPNSTIHIHAPQKPKTKSKKQKSENDPLSFPNGQIIVHTFFFFSWLFFFMMKVVDGSHVPIKKHTQNKQTQLYPSIEYGTLSSSNELRRWTWG